MKKLLLFALLLVSANKSSAMDQSVELSSQQELSSRLCSMGLNHFVEKTRIDKQLGGQQKHPLGVVTAVELALYDYDQCVQNKMVAVQMQMFKPMIVKAFLQEHPQAIDYLKQQNLLQ